MNAAFECQELGPFDFALAQSVFTHLPFNTIIRCVANVTASLRPGGRFYATYFANPGPRLRVEPAVLPSPGGGLQTYCDSDPYYYDPDIFRWICEGSDISVENRGAWGHPRSQHMLVFSRIA